MDEKDLFIKQLEAKRTGRVDGLASSYADR